jgi:hypothetical protein
MNAKTRYTNEPLGKLKVIPNFLPPADKLVFRDDTVKVTIALSRSSIEFFKREAKRNNTQYQKMIRRLLDIYTESQERDINAEKQDKSGSGRHRNSKTG